MQRSFDDVFAPQSAPSKLKIDVENRHGNISSNSHLHSYKNGKNHNYDIESDDNRDQLLSPSKISKQDGRLFPYHPLYCEGYPRPKLRGLIHLFAVILLPFAWRHLFLEANGSLFGQIIASLYVLSNILCYGVSAIFHVGRWSVQTEIFLQKLDHCGIAILSTGTMLPASLLLLPPKIGLPFISITILLCIWTCTRIFQLRPSVWRQVVVAASCTPFLPFCYFYMNRIEWFAVWVTIVLQALGVLVFVRKQPDLIPSFFGYHEVFHILVVGAGLSVYLLNWSIIHRTCNPYDLHTDVAEILWHIFVDSNFYR